MFRDCLVYFYSYFPKNLLVLLTWNDAKNTEKNRLHIQWVVFPIPMELSCNIKIANNKNHYMPLDIEIE